MKELCALKRCLQRHTRQTASAHSVQDKETYATLFSVELQPPSQDLVPLLVHHQTILLRLVVMSKRPTIVESIVDQVDPRNPLAPSAVLLEALKCGEQKDRTVKQLEALVRSLVSLCPSPAHPEDATATNPDLHPSPDAVFKIQVFALLIQSYWWPLAGHNAHVEKELQIPLSRFLDAYKRRSRSSPNEKYESARSLVSLLLPLDSLLRSVTSWSPSIFSIMKTLGLLAQADARTPDALAFADSMAKAAAWSPNPRVLGITCNLRKIALQLENGSHLPESLRLLRELKSELSLPLDVSGDTQGLLNEADAVRRAALKTLTGKYATLKAGSEAEELSLVADLVFLRASLQLMTCLLYTSPSPRDGLLSRMPSSA